MQFRKCALVALKSSRNGSVAGIMHICEWNTFLRNVIDALF